MDAGTPPMIVEIQKIEKHDIKAEVIEHVARLLCRADGLDPDADWRGLTLVHVPYPSNLNWSKYREKAEDRLKSLFKAP